MSSFYIPGVITPSQKALVRSWWRKVTAANPKAKNFEAMKVPVVEKGVFGIPLTESIKYAYSNISYIDDYTGKQCYGVIPTIVAKCGSYLKEEGLYTEGIFRISGSVRRIGLLQTIFDTPEEYGSKLDWRGYTVHDAANVLRRFLNHLPEPVIVNDLYRVFKDTMRQSFDSLDDKVNAFQNLIEQLPLPHQYLLLYLLDMLSMFSQTSNYTRMDASALSSVFTPGVLCHPDDAMNPASYGESQKVIEFLVNHQASFTMPRVYTSLQDVAQDVGCESCRPSASQQLPLSQTGRSVEDVVQCRIPHRDSSQTDINALLFKPTPAPKPSPSPHSTFRLSRSRTMPSKRLKYGEHELPQIVHLNRNLSQGAKTDQYRRQLTRSTSNRLVPPR